ncbi:MAG: acyl carrier protein [Alphaproteobacteria bacterium]|jgi:acyl carrier protein
MGRSVGSAVTDSHIEDQISAFLRNRFPALGSGAIALNAPLLDSGAIDSLGILDVMAHLGEAFSIVIEDEDFTPENFETLASLTELVRSKRVAA